MLHDFWLVISNLAQSPLVWMPALTATIVAVAVVLHRPTQ